MRNDPEIEFAVRMIKNGILIILIALAAIGLHFLVASLKNAGAPPLFTDTLKIVEYLLFFGDVLWFLRLWAEEIAEVLRGAFSSRLVGFLVVLGIALITAAVLPYSRILDAMTTNPSIKQNK